MEVHKKIWPEFFELIKSGKKNCELRLADFSIAKGDMLVLEEFDPNKKEYTGRKLVKKIKALHRVDLARMYNIEDVKSKGLYLMEIE